MSDLRKAAEQALWAAKLLYANAEGCAVNHHQADFEQQGLPGWLKDCSDRIATLDAALAAEDGRVIALTPAEIQSGLDRVRWAELLIRQLPPDHDGRNSWLLNYARAEPEPLAADTPATPSDAELVGIWSCEYDAWWRPNACGYTKDSACAGVWSRSEAEKIADAEKEKHLIARTIPIHPDAAAAIERLTRERDEALNAFSALKAAFKAYGQALAAMTKERDDAIRHSQNTVVSLLQSENALAAEQALEDIEDDDPPTLEGYWRSVEEHGQPPRGVLVVATNGKDRWIDFLAYRDDEMRLVFGERATHWFPIDPPMPPKPTHLKDFDDDIIF